MRRRNRQLKNPGLHRMLQNCVFALENPGPCRNTGANLVWESINEKTPMTIISQMPQEGVIFSDRVDINYLEFNSGAVAKIEIAEKQVTLLSF